MSRTLACLAALLCLPALSAPPSQWSNCAGCHAPSGSASNPPFLPPTSNIVPKGAGSTDVTDLRNIMGAVAFNPMGTVLASISDGDLGIVRLYLIDVRDGRVSVTGGSSTAFGSTFVGTAGSVQSFTITNERGVAATFASVPSGSNGEFAVVSGGTCPTGTSGTIAAEGSCTVNVQFFPSGTGSRSGALRFTLNSPTGITAQQVSLGLSGTGLDPAPVYSPNGFAAFTSPGFTAPTNGSATVCRTITNANLAGGNALSIALSAGQSGATDYSNYYEIGSVADCAGVWPAQCVPTASSVTGGPVLIAAGGGSCTVPIKFNPGKFGFAGGTGTRAAQLTVTHNAPTAGQTATYTLVGIATTGPEPRIGITTNPAVVAGQVSPPAFSNQVILTTSALWNDFLVSNTGTADGLDITQVLNSNPSEFALSENCVAAPPLAILSGSGPTCTIGLTFTPSALGQRCTTITVRAAFSSNGDQSVQVCGTGVPVPVPQMDVTPGSVAFGNRSIGAVYLPASVVVSNLPGATLALQIGAVAISGTGFSFVPDASSCQNRSLAAGTSCTLQVQFTPDPSAPGMSYAANLTIDSNDPTTPHRVIPLTGTALAAALPVLQWQGVTSPLSFPGLVIAGQSSPTTLVARLVSAGPGAADVQSVRLVGADAANFSASSCPALLYEGEFCDVSLTFMPGSGGTKIAQLEVVSATGVVPALVTVQGQGVGGTSPFVNVSTTALTFGGVRVGARSEPLAITLAAGGDGVLQVDSISADAPFSVAMTTCPTPPFTLPVGADCRISVTYTPTDAAVSSGKLHILTNNGTSTTDVSLDGVGQPAADVSGGGLADETLWLPALLAAAVLWLRTRRRG